MSLEGRLSKLESGSGSARCPECGTAPDASTEFTVGTNGPWEGYPEPLLCGGCGTALRFTLKLGDAVQARLEGGT